MSEILNAKEICKTYATHVALDKVSITVPEGAVYGLLGPNGAGKTSLIRIINQITGPDSGEIYFRGKKLHANNTNDIGYLPEERGLYKKMEVGEQALYLAQLKGLSRQEALSRLKFWFEKFEIKGWWRKKIEELSKGMQQKVQFIVTVVHEPKLLILDEPFTGFDPINANLIKDELLALKKAGTSIILSTHRMESVEELCTHIALIDKSKRLLEGAVADIRKSFRSNTYEIVYEGNNISLANSLWGGFELIESASDNGVNKARIKLDAGASTNQLIQGLINNVTLLGFNEVIPSMNDIFIQTINPNNNPVSYE